jgi:hypothetical protein
MSSYVLVYSSVDFGMDIDLGNGLVIRQLNNPLSVFDLAALGANGFSEWAILEPYLNYAQFEIESKIERVKENRFDILNRVWLLSRIMYHRGIYIQCLAGCSKSWNEIAGISKKKETKLDCTFQILDYHREIIKDPEQNAKEIDDSDVDWIKEYFDKYDELYHEHNGFITAMISSVNWKYSNSPRLAIACIWAGIESLFSINSELVFRISLEIANFIEKDTAKRKALFKHVKDIYGLRSKAVHGDNMNDNELLSTIHESYFILRDLISRIIANGHHINERDIDILLFGE